MTEHKPRTIVAPVAIMCVTLLTLGAVGLSWSTMREQAHVIDELSVNSDALRDQVKGAGETPVAPPAEKVTGQTGAAGARGEKGERGEKGANGDQGDIGLPGQSGPAGPAGKDGTNGADSTTPGPSGPAGADSTVPGPQGPVGPQGPSGPPGGNAPTVIGIQCLDTGDGQFTFSDMSIIVVPNMCQTAPIIPEIPTPEEAP